MGKRISKSVLAALVSAVLLFALLPSGLLPAMAAEAAALQIGVVSDVHLFPEELVNSPRFLAAKVDFGKQFLQSEGILRSVLAALEEHAKKNGLKFVLLPGDLTKDGELPAHERLADMLKDFESRTGIQVAVVPGNHDINNGGGGLGSAHRYEPTSPEKYLELYQELGYDLPNLSRFIPAAGKKGGMLSYAADLGGRYRLIALDLCKYSDDQNGGRGDTHRTGGMLSAELLEWALNEIQAARRAGKTVIGMGHHNLMGHLGPQEKILLDFVVDDWFRVREALADAGMHYYFSGHIHNDDIGHAYSDSGELIYDISTASITGFPSTFREVRFTAEGSGSISAQVETFAVDCVLPVTANGVTYPSPYGKTSHKLSFGESNLQDFLLAMVSDTLRGVFGEMQGTGGVSVYLKSMGVDIEGMLDTVLQGGIRLGSIDIFTARNLTGFIDALLTQVDKAYVARPEYVIGLVNGVLDRLMGLQVSQYPSTRFYEEYGVGDPKRPGTLDDLASEVILYTYTRAGDAEKNKFLMDAISSFESGTLTDQLLEALIDIVLDDLLQNELLPTLKLELSPIFRRSLTRWTLGALLDGVLRLILWGDTSFSAVVDFVFNLGLLPWESLPDTVDTLMEAFWTESQSESFGAQLGEFLREFVIDKQDYDDLNVTLRYTGRKSVTATQAEFQLPTLLSQAVGEDPQTTRVISWFTKDSVKGTDIELTDAAGNSVLGSVKIEKATEAVERSYPGADLGLLGLFSIPRHLNRHSVTLSGLKPGKEYRFRVGDASRGWWSPEGVIRTANGGKTTTFLSFTDQQAQTEKQYARSWGELAAAALRKFPRAELIVSAGDQVDMGTSLKQWQWLFDTAQPVLRKLPLMPATGNHEDKEGAIGQYFSLDHLLPEQDGESGLYYAFDYNNIHFVILNTNDLENGRLSAAQLEWLRADMEANAADWNIFVFHKSIFSDGSHIKDSDVVELRKQLPPLFKELGADLVIMGHDHTYLRTETEGVKYITAGTSGVKFYNVQPPELTDLYFDRPEAAVEIDSPVFGAYITDNDTLTYEAYQLLDSGALEKIDSFSLRKESIEPFVAPAGWESGWESLNSIFPDTADGPATIVIIPLSLLLAAAAALLLLRKERQEPVPAL
ncbi:MAG: metallophosphoesterase [Oscillospiraceae bacterium]|nr:metallophosphoesterase [Oscillospiraceae bacterium]